MGVSKKTVVMTADVPTVVRGVVRVGRIIEFILCCGWSECR